MKSCWIIKPEERPSFTALASSIYQGLPIVCRQVSENPSYLSIYQSITYNELSGIWLLYCFCITYVIVAIYTQLHSYMANICCVVEQYLTTCTIMLQPFIAVFKQSLVTKLASQLICLILKFCTITMQCANKLCKEFGATQLSMRTYLHNACIYSRQNKDNDLEIFTLWLTYKCIASQLVCSYTHRQLSLLKNHLKIFIIAMQLSSCVPSAHHITAQ